MIGAPGLQTEHPVDLSNGDLEWFAMAGAGALEKLAQMPLPSLRAGGHGVVRWLRDLIHVRLAGKQRVEPAGAVQRAVETRYCRFQEVMSSMLKGTLAQPVALLCVAALCSAHAFGWSAEADRAIAMIATKRLQGSTTAAAVARILGKLTLADIATCPDEVRDLDDHGTKMSAICSAIFPNPPKGTAPWHYVAIPIKGPTFTPVAKDVMAACMDVCALAQIKTYLIVLSHSSPDDAGDKKLADQQALSYVVHFIGDVHQPLNAADRNGDRGGNAEHVKFFTTDKIPLHSIWDNQIVARIDKTPEELVTDLHTEITTANAEPNNTPAGWAIQSYIYARDVAYKGIPEAPKDAQHKDDDVATLGQAYQDAAAPVVRMQIARAGVRLASALQSALQ